MELFAPTVIFKNLLFMILFSIILLFFKRGSKKEHYTKELCVSLELCENTTSISSIPAHFLTQYTILVISVGIPCTLFKILQN